MMENYIGNLLINAKVKYSFERIGFYGFSYIVKNDKYELEILVTKNIVRIEIFRKEYKNYLITYKQPKELFYPQTFRETLYNNLLILDFIRS